LWRHYSARVSVSPEDQSFAAEAMVLGLEADAPIGFAVHDEELRFEVVSDALAAMNGRPAAEHLGRGVTEILPAALGGHVEALLAEVRDTGESRHGVELEGTTDAHPGERRSWVGSFYPLTLPEGRRVGVVVIDVTERRRMQEALRESERVLSGAQRMAALGWWTWIARPETVVYAPELLSMMGRDPALGGTPQSRDQLEFAEPAEMESVRRDALAALEHGTPFARRIRACRADGELRLLDARATLVYDHGVPVGLQGFVQDITDLARAEERERLVAELGQQALAGAGLSELMERAITAVVGQIGIDGAAVLELAENGEELLVRANRSTFAAPAAAERIPLERGSVPDHVLTTGQPIVIEDTETDERFPQTPAERAAGARSVAAVVIGGRGRPFGLLGTMSRQPGRVERNDLTFLQAIANVIADAVERHVADSEIALLSAARGRLVAQALDAEERARRRMSETLHDGALQDLLAAGHDLYALESQDDAVRDVQARLMAIVRGLREVMSSMHPTVLQYGGLEAALRAVADQHGRSGGFEPRVSVDPAAVGARDELLLSVARELLENAARHASANAVAVEVRRDGDEIVIDVVDDGAGFGPERPERALAEGGIGLAACRERVEALGGTFAVRATPGAGTRVRATAPVLANPAR
jgi:PAS domain-containing protein/two-component sensor histidine kinase